MRRKSEKSKVHATPERTSSRRISRRGKKSPSQSPEIEREEIINEETEPEVAKAPKSDSESDKEPVVKTPRKPSRFDTDAKGVKVARGNFIETKDNINDDRENGDKDGDTEESDATKISEQKQDRSENIEFVAEPPPERPESSNEEEIIEEHLNEHEKIDEGVEEETTDKKSPEPEKEESVEQNDSVKSSPNRESPTRSTPSPQRETSVSNSPPPQEPIEQRSRKITIDRRETHSDDENNSEHSSSSPEPTENKRIQESEEASQSNEKENQTPEHHNTEKSPEIHRTNKRDEQSEEKEVKSAQVENEIAPIKPTIQKRRKWTSRSKRFEPKPIIAISTDSLKNIISDVHPVPLSDIRLDSSPEPIYDDEPPLLERQISNKSTPQERRRTTSTRENSIQIEVTEISGATVRTTSRDNSESTAKVRKISAKNDEPINQTKHISSNILYITNLVRPFTLLQLKGLLARTGKIVENGFWIDKIKSRCYVKYETEE